MKDYGRLLGTDGGRRVRWLGWSTCNEYLARPPSTVFRRRDGPCHR